ncbi:response regulator transcription factor [Streptomyces sp. HNM0574]|uniref:helix-turn-helix transcriptional regulator n=1 Tax=Streptomyces sp. HNM0574 TaxID=2714954 RepID=UPI00146AB63D|nr:response regulator transcription factor [Streptomyces sp. HNM0574]NLU69989.1 response regulator transcription factor [Streptomyces sp. HNM0574]
MARIRVLVVDDHRIFAESLAAALAAEQDVEVVAAGSVPAALRALDRAAADGRRFDVVLVDDGLAGLDGQDPAANGTAPANGGPNGAPAEGGSGAEPAAAPAPFLARVASAHPRLRTVVLAERDDAARAAAALQAGAGGWIGKDCSLSRLLQVIRGVLRNETHLAPALLTHVLRELTATRKHRTESELLVEALTPREREVLRCMVAGLGRKAVAERLYLSPHTVRTHMQNVLGKLGVHSTLAAVALARRAGVGPADLDPAPVR